MRLRHRGPIKTAVQRDRGFTLVEILVVILIIGIIAAIAIPVFLNQRAQAVEASLQADMKQARRLMTAYQLETLAAVGTQCFDTTACHASGVPGGPGHVLTTTLNMKFSKGNRVGDFWGGSAGGAVNTFHLCLESTTTAGTPTQFYAIDTHTSGNFSWEGKGGCPWTGVGPTEPQPAP